MNHPPAQPGIAAMLARSPVIPVVTLVRAEDAVPLARALAAGGVTVIEITLRSPVAVEGLRRVVAEVPEMLAGAGTVTRREDYARVVEAGARFVVSPGATDTLLSAAREFAVPLLPGVMTVSEAMRLAEQGYEHLKLFPADVAGGPEFLAAIHAPLPALRFCPTGGIGLANLGRYLRLPNVACVGGSWLAPRDRIAAGDWAAITEAARAAVSVGGPRP